MYEFIHVSRESVCACVLARERVGLVASQGQTQRACRRSNNALTAEPAQASLLGSATPSLDVMERCARRRKAAARGSREKLRNVSFLIFHNKNSTFTLHPSSFWPRKRCTATPSSDFRGAQAFLLSENPVPVYLGQKNKYSVFPTRCS
jgi:hypothetical protein